MLSLPTPDIFPRVNQSNHFHGKINPKLNKRTKPEQKKYTLLSDNVYLYTYAHLLNMQGGVYIWKLLQALYRLP